MTNASLKLCFCKGTLERMTFRKPLSEYYLKRSGWVKLFQGQFQQQLNFPALQRVENKDCDDNGGEIPQHWWPQTWSPAGFPIQENLPTFFCIEPATNPPGFTWIICGSQWNAKEGESVRGIWARFKWFKHAYLFFLAGVFRARVCRWNIQTNRVDWRWMGAREGSCC